MFNKRNILFIIFLLLVMGSITFFGYEKLIKERNEIINPTLVKSVTRFDKVKGDWKQTSKVNYEYENNYPVKKELYEHDSKTPIIEKYNYAFKNNVPTKMESYDENGNNIVTIKYKNGNVYDESRVSEDKSSILKRYYQYANQDNYFTLVFHKNMSVDISGNAYPTYIAEEVDSVSVTTKNGLLKKTINTGIYTNYDEGNDDEWFRFNGTYTANYDNNGIVKDTYVKNRAGYSGIEHKFELTKEDGKISEVIRFTWNNSTNEWMEDMKILFDYTDNEINKERYASMINAHIMQEENTYYFYFWN